VRTVLLALVGGETAIAGDGSRSVLSSLPDFDSLSSLPDFDGLVASLELTVKDMLL
jgi:hypothetical protein